MRLEYLPEKYRRQAEAQINPNRPAIPAPNVERPARSKPLEAPKDPKMDSQCRLHVLCKRHRLADPDGISVKAAIDGLVLAGILADDSARQIVESPTICQTKIKGDEAEETIITLTEIDR